MENLDSRVERLERGYRRMQQVTVAALVLAALAVVAAFLGSAGPAGTVVASRLTLTDEQGRPRATLSTAEDGYTGLVLNDAAGNARALLGVSKDGSPKLRFSTAEGNTLAELTVYSDEAPRLSALRDRLEQGILATVPRTEVNGARDARVPNTTNISFDRVEAESLLIALDLEGIAVSTGSACSSGTLEPSHVLKAMGLPVHRTQNSIRFSLGSANSKAEIDRVVAVLPGVVDKLRSLTRTPVRG